MALPKPQLNEDVLAYDEKQTDEINRTRKVELSRATLTSPFVTSNSAFVVLAGGGTCTVTTDRVADFMVTVSLHVSVTKNTTEVTIARNQAAISTACIATDTQTMQYVSGTHIFRNVPIGTHHFQIYVRRTQNGVATVHPYNLISIVAVEI